MRLIKEQNMLTTLSDFGLFKQYLKVLNWKKSIHI